MHGLGPSCSAEGGGGCGMRHYTPNANGCYRDIVNRRYDARPVCQGHERDRVRSHIADVRYSQSEKAPFGIQSERAFGGKIARLEIAEKRFAPVADPFHRPLNAPRRPQRKYEFR